MTHVSVGRLVLLILFVFSVELVQSCNVSGQGLAEKLEGTWKPDLEQTEKLLDELGEDKGVLDELADLTVVFDNGKFKFVSPDQTLEGWFQSEIKDSDEKTLNIKLQISDENLLNGTVTFQSDTRIKIVPEGETPVIFVLQQTEEAGKSKFQPRLIGQWQGNAKATKKLNTALKLESAQIEMATDQVGHMKIKIDADGDYVLTMGTADNQNETKGEWKLGARDEDGKFDFHAESEEGPLQFKIWFEDKENLAFRIGDGPATVFSKKPGKTSDISARSDGQKHWCVYEPEHSDENTRHIVLISGDEEYRSEEALPMLGKILAKHHGFRCSVLFAINEETGEIDPNNQNNIPGMHLLEDADLVVMALRFRQLPDDQMKFFDDYLNAGKPIIGLRTSTHAFRYPKDSSSEYKEYSFNSKDWAGGFGKQVLGETWISHHGHHKVESTRGVINPRHASHSILEGVSDIWGPTDVYGVRELPENAVVLVHGQVLTGMKPDDPPVVGKKNEPMMPLVWIRNHETESGSQARIFCTTMGSSTDFENAGLRRLLVNACYWAMGMEQDILDESKVDIVGEFNPTDYGFNSFKKGMKPSDYDLKD